MDSKIPERHSAGNLMVNSSIRACIFPLLLMLACMTPAAHSYSSAEVWCLSEWLAEMPDQAALMADFTRTVEAPALKIDCSRQHEIKIAIVYPAIQSSDYWRRNVAALHKRLKEKGLLYSITTYYSRPGELELQTSQIKQALASDPDYLIFTMDSISDEILIERLVTRGRPRLILQNITTPLRGLGMRQPMLYVGFDHEKGTTLIAEYFLKAYPNGAKWALLLFTKGYVSDLRGGTFQKVVAQNPKMKLAEMYLTDGDSNRAKQCALDAMRRHKDLNFIFACATDVAMGAIEALQETNKTGEIAINGWGGGTNELSALVQGKLSVTAMRMTDDAGIAIAEAICLDAQGKSSKIPVVFSGSFELISADTDHLTIKKLTDRAFRCSGQGEMK